MEPMQLHARVGSDGILRLEIPFESKDAGSDVLVTVEPVPVSRPSQADHRGAGFCRKRLAAARGVPKKGPRNRIAFNGADGA